MNFAEIVKCSLGLKNLRLVLDIMGNCHGNNRNSLIQYKNNKNKFNMPLYGE